MLIDDTGTMITRFFLPHSEPYFAHLAEMAIKVKHGGELFETMFSDFKNREKYSEKIKEIEVECDTIVDRIIDSLNSTYITPIDREDIHLLVTALDDVIDYINGLARKMEIYGVKKVRPEAEELASLLSRCTNELSEAFSLLESKQEIGSHAKIIDRLEKQADTVYQDAVKHLFKKEKDPIEVVRWNTLFEALEDAVDRCKDLAGTLTSVVVKNK